jgi:hypothetical protein
MYIIFTGNRDKVPFQVMTNQTVVVASAHLLGAHWDRSWEERCLRMITLWNLVPCSLGEGGRATESSFGP